MKPLSFRLRIALLSTVISGVVLVGFGEVAWLQIQHLRMDALDRELRSLALRHPGWFANRGGYERLTSALEFIFGDQPAGRLIVQVQDPAGRTLFRSAQWPASLGMPPAAPGETNIVTEASERAEFTPAAPSMDARPPGPPALGGPGRGGGAGGGGRGPGFGRSGGAPVVFARPPSFRTLSEGEAVWRLGHFETADSTLVIGLDYASIQSELERTRRVFLLALPAALFLIGLGGWVVAGRALRPLNSIAETAERVTAHGLDQRVPESREAPEIQRLIAVLNRMMDRLETSFHQASRFSADASHELKTPLAVMQGEIEVALREAGPEAQDVLAGLLEQTQRLKKITRSLLLLAQADAGRLALTRTSVNLSTELEAMMEDARIRAADLGHTIQVNVASGLLLEADPGLLRTAVFNLLDNAVKYAGRNGQVRIDLAAPPDRLSLRVGNSGPGIPAEDRARVFDRFYRVGGLRQPGAEGTGLGLSLAREIARAHGGEVELRESRPEWTEFELTLPRGG